MDEFTIEEEAPCLICKRDMGKYSHLMKKSNSYEGLYEIKIRTSHFRCNVLSTKIKKLRHELTRMEEVIHELTNAEDELRELCFEIHI